MHRAPAVSIFVAPSRWQLRVVAALALLAMVSATGFLLSQPDFGWQALTTVLLTFVVVLMAVRSWRHAPHGELAWNGQQWSWSSFPAPGICTLSLRMDFQSVMVVALVPAGARPTHLWLESVRDQAHWHAVRRAVIGSRGEPAIEVDPVPAMDPGGRS